MLSEWEVTSVCDKFYIFFSWWWIKCQIENLFFAVWFMNEFSIVALLTIMRWVMTVMHPLLYSLDDWFYPDIILFAYVLSNIILKMIFSSIYLVLNELLLIKSRRWWKFLLLMSCALKLEIKLNRQNKIMSHFLSLCAMDRCVHIR